MKIWINTRAPSPSGPSWRPIRKLDDGQRAYALYFLARGAMTAGDMGQVTALANDALQLFLKDKSDIPEFVIVGLVDAGAAERSGRGQGGPELDARIRKVHAGNRSGLGSIHVSQGTSVQEEQYDGSVEGVFGSAHIQGAEYALQPHGGIGTGERAD